MAAAIPAMSQVAGSPQGGSVGGHAESPGRCRGVGLMVKVDLSLSCVGEPSGSSSNDLLVADDGRHCVGGCSLHVLYTPRLQDLYF